MTPRTGIAYRVHIGRYVAVNDPRSTDRSMLFLVVERGMDAPGHCAVVLAGPGFAPVSAGDAVTVDLDVGQGWRRAFTGAARETAAGVTGQTIEAVDDLTKLAACHVEASYEAVGADFVVRDLISKAGARAGAIAPGPSLLSYAVHRQPRVAHHVGVLAALAGADVWTDCHGLIQVGAPKQGAADHRFILGKDILLLELREAPPPRDGVEIWGEGAASARGSDAAHWLTTDLSGATAKASVGPRGQVQDGEAGKRPMPLADGALRSGQAAGDAAGAWAKAHAARWIRGRIEVPGAPEVEPGDLVGIEGLPPDHCVAAFLPQGRMLRVRSVRHTLDRRHGVRTRLGF